MRDDITSNGGKSIDAGHSVSRRSYLKTAGAGVAATSLAGCSFGGGSGNDTFTLGGVWATSQGWGTWGNMMKQTVEYTVEQINNNGGIDGKDVEFILEDSKIDPKTTADKTKKLIDKNGADVILGPNASSSRVAMSDVLKQKEVPGCYFIYYEGVKAPDYCNPWLFKYMGVPHGTVTPNIDFLMEKFGKSVYLIGNDYVWPRTTHQAVKDEVKKRGGEILGSTYVQIGTTDFSSIIPKIEETNPDVVWAVLTSNSALAFQQASLNQGVKGNWGQVHHSLTPLTIQDANPDAVEGVYESHVYFPTDQNPANQKLIQGIKDKYGSDAAIDVATGPGNVAVHSIKQAVENAGGTSPEDIRKGLSNFKMEDTPMGPVEMGPDHQLKSKYKLAQVDRGPTYKIKRRSDPLSPPETCSDI